MNVDEETIKERCTDAVFERGVNYRDEGRIQRLDRFDDHVTATVHSVCCGNFRDHVTDIGVSRRVTDILLHRSGKDSQQTLSGVEPVRRDCRIREANTRNAVYLSVRRTRRLQARRCSLAGYYRESAQDESEDVEAVLADASAEELRAFVRDVLAENTELRDQFLSRFGDDHKSVDEYRDEIGQLFETHADPVVFEAIDFSRFFEVAEQYRDRERYLAAATVYRAIFEEVDERYNLVDGAYDHYARTIQRALDGYVECVLANDPDPETFDTYASVLEACASREPPTNSEQFGRVLDDLEERYNA